MSRGGGAHTQPLQMGSWLMGAHSCRGAHRLLLCLQQSLQLPHSLSSSLFLKKNKHNYKRLRPPRVITLNLLPRVFKTAITRITDALHQQWLHKDPAVPTQLWRNSPSIYSVRIRKQVTAAKDFSSLSLQFSVLCCLLLTSSLFDLVHSSSKWRRPLRRERRRKKYLIR